MNSSNRTIPAGITFGTKVCKVPDYPHAFFTHSGNVTDLFGGNNNYHWIKRGDAIGTFSLYRPNVEIPIIGGFFGDKKFKAQIRSPVSGLLLHCYLDSGFAILLPDDEHAAENGSYVYGRALDICRDNKDVLMKSSRQWSMGGMDEASITNTISTTTQAQCEYLDALPRYQDYINEARTNHPELRPYLKHF